MSRILGACHTEQKTKIIAKFKSDLNSATDADPNLKAFVFFTNINLTNGEKESLVLSATDKGLQHCEIIDRERIRIALDSVDGFCIRFQFLAIPMSEAEQASFFSRWGDDIQSFISSGFQKIEGTLKRVLFLQEANDPLSQLVFSFEMDKKYTAEEIGHFRLFCYLTLKEPKHDVLSLLFGASDKSNRMRADLVSTEKVQKSGIKHGISTGQWDQHINREMAEKTDDEETEKWTMVSCGSGIGRDSLEFLAISYSKDFFIRFYPVFTLRDLDESMFLPIINKSFAEKIKAIHIYSNGYKLQEIDSSNMTIDSSGFEPNIPARFDEEELKDQWVRIRPKHASNFRMSFFEHTPKRMFLPVEVQNSLEERQN